MFCLIYLFDRYYIFNNNSWILFISVKAFSYFNLKFICDNGGAQTRTLREVYHFIKSQMEFLIKKKQIFHFINILDGDTSFKNMDKFHYLKSNKKYKDIIKYIFIGDLHQFQNHFQEYIQQ